MNDTSSHRQRILIVEDDTATYLSLRRLLEHYECDVEHAGTINEGIRGLQKKPQYMLLDLMLPDGEGTKILEQVKSKKLGTKVIVITGAGEPMREKAMRFNPEAVLQKPVNFMQILEMMKPVA